MLRLVLPQAMQRHKVACDEEDELEAMLVRQQHKVACDENHELEAVLPQAMQRHTVACDEEDELEAMLVRQHEQRKAAASANHCRMCPSDLGRRPSDLGHGKPAVSAKGAEAASAASHEQEQGGGALTSALRSQGGGILGACAPAEVGRSRSYQGPSSLARAPGGSADAIASFQKIRWRQAERKEHASTVSSIRELTVGAAGGAARRGALLGTAWGSSRQPTPALQSAE